MTRSHSASIEVGHRMRVRGDPGVIDRAVEPPVRSTAALHHRLGIRRAGDVRCWQNEAVPPLGLDPLRHCLAGLDVDVGTTTWAPAAANTRAVASPIPSPPR